MVRLLVDILVLIISLSLLLLLAAGAIATLIALRELHERVTRHLRFPNVWASLTPGIARAYTANPKLTVAAAVIFAALLLLNWHIILVNLARLALVTIAATLLLFAIVFVVVNARLLILVTRSLYHRWRWRSIYGIRGSGERARRAMDRLVDEYERSLSRL